MPPASVRRGFSRTAPRTSHDHRRKPLKRTMSWVVVLREIARRVPSRDQTKSIIWRSSRSTSVPPQAQFAAQLGVAQNQDFHGQFSHIVPMRSNASPSGTDGIRSTARLYECCAPGIRMVTNASAANCLMEQRPPSLLSKTGTNLATRVANGGFTCPELEF